jgi:hypothetical protein
MPIFGRRQLQQMLNDLGPWLTPHKAKELRNRLENPNPDHAVAAEYELALLRAVSKVASLEIDRKMGRKTPDIFSEDLLPGRPIAADVAAVSDASLSGETLMRTAAKIINGVCDEITQNASRHLHYTFQETSGYTIENGRSKFTRSRSIDRLFRKDSALSEVLKGWLSDGPPTQPLHWKSKHIDVVISWRDYVHPQTNTFSSMPSLAYDLRKNPLYAVLKRKADEQLCQVPSGVQRAIFLGDAGCNLLRNIKQKDPTGRFFSGQQIIQTFLLDEETIDLVLVFTPQRVSRSVHDISSSVRVWSTHVFDRRAQTPGIEADRLFSLRDNLPAPYLESSQARSWHEQGMCMPQSRGHSLPTKMSIGRNSMTVKLSARALQELMAGRLTSQQFESLIRGKGNPFEVQLAKGRTISRIDFEPRGLADDDDYIVIEFDDDPAAATLRLPDRLKREVNGR